MGVFLEIFNTLLPDGLITMDQVHIPDKLVDKDVLELAHCPEYVGHFLNGTLDAQKTRRIGFGDQTKTQTLIDRLVPKLVAPCSQLSLLSLMG